ncbi:MAG: TlpA disulfide reductase family protein, partial [Pseudomonadota bacterium]
GTLVGDFWSGLKSHESWTAHRDDDASLPDADSLTFLKEGYERFEFSFPDTTGTAVSLDDPRFHGKAVVITLAGSWCPNCHDEAAFMATLYDKYRDDGLEVIALMFEHSGEFDGAAEQVRRFRDKFDIDYTTLIAGSSDKTLAAEALPQLNHVLAFPTTIFIGRDGSVRRIHTGFSGPGTGEHYTRLTRDFTRYVEGLLAENTPAAGDDPGAAGPEPEPDDASGDTTST